MSKTTSAQWAKRVDDWKGSGLSAKEFAAQAGLNPSTLTYWKWRLRADAAVGDAAVGGVSEVGSQQKKRRRREKNVPQFVEVPAASVTPATIVLELVMSSGVCLRIPAGFDEVTLVRVMRAVEAAR